jgi:hypothetical protein
MILKNRYLSYRITVISQILDKENQVEPSREFRIGEYNRKLYSRIVGELDKERLIEPKSIYYNYPVERINQKPRN